MKTIGILGGMSWQSTNLYYRHINESINEKLSGLNSAKIVMHSFNFDEIAKLQAAGDWATMTKLFIDASRALEQAGADFIVIATNTMHKIADAVASHIAIPILHIADATAQRLVAKNIKTVALLGTKFTMQEDFYKKRLSEAFGINVLVPNLEQQQLIHNTIYNELCLGKIVAESRLKITEIIAELKQQGATAVVLGCTELIMLFENSDCSLPIFDTTKIHTDAIVDYAILPMPEQLTEEQEQAFAVEQLTKEQKQAFDVLQNHKKHKYVLITGVAGSGKTYLVNKFKEDSHRKISVTASTGIAASNINGTTIHNWAGLGVRNEKQLKESIDIISKKMLKHYRDSIINTDTLIIDEVSMLHAYQLDAVDQITRKIRNCEQPFGGMQVILVGDFMQLPPVPDKDPKTKRPIEVKFIVKSEVYKSAGFKVCYLHQLVRAKENDKLTEILNAIRKGIFSKRDTPELYEQLLARKRAKLDEKLEVTRLCTTNKTADHINSEKNNELSGESHFYDREGPTGDSSHFEDLENIVKNRVPKVLELKVGTVVIFTKNDPDRRFFNGNIGKVIAFSKGSDNKYYPDVKLNTGVIQKTIGYSEFYIADENKKKLATIKQLPLRLGWAITVHKSQGLTLDAAEIDLTKIYQSGLGYVALSRVRSLEDLSLIKDPEKNAFALEPKQKAIDEDLKKQNEIDEDLKK